MYYFHVTASPSYGFMAPDALLRFFAIAGLFSICVFVLIFHRTPLSIGLTVIGIVAAVLIENYYEYILPKAARKFLEQNQFL